MMGQTSSAKRFFFLRRVTRSVALFLLRLDYGFKEIRLFPRPDGMQTVAFGRHLWGVRVIDLIRTHDLSKPGSWFGIPHGYQPSMLQGEA